MWRKRDEAYYAMYHAYLENEDAYWAWATERKIFGQRGKERFYYRKGVNRAKRKALVEAVLRDFPDATLREVASQTGGCKEIIYEFGYWNSPHDLYWFDGVVGQWTVYDRLKHYPDEIYEAIEETYEWSKKIRIRTTVVEEVIPIVLRDIGERWAHREEVGNGVIFSELDGK